MKHVIEVTEGDIREAKRLRKARLEGRAHGLLSESCPVALAARRVFGNQVKVWEDRIDRGPEDEPLDLPEKAVAFILGFDLGDSMEPFSFEVEE